MRDVPAEQKLAKRHERIGEFVDALGKGTGVQGLERGVLLTIRVRFPTEEEPSTLLVIRGAGPTGAVVGFVGAYGLGDALLAWRARLAGKGMKWREDIPWGERV